MIKALTWAMENKKGRISDEDRMLYLLKKGGNYVNKKKPGKVLALFTE